MEIELEYKLRKVVNVDAKTKEEAINKIENSDLYELLDLKGAKASYVENSLSYVEDEVIL